MSSVLEHIPKKDLYDLVNIKRRGLFLAIVPDGKSFYSKEHLIIFNYKKVKIYFPQAEIERLKFTDKEGWFIIKQII